MEIFNRLWLSGNYRGKEGESFLLTLSQQNIKFQKRCYYWITKVVVAKKN